MTPVLVQTGVIPTLEVTGVVHTGRDRGDIYTGTDRTIPTLERIGVIPYRYKQVGDHTGIYGWGDTHTGTEWKDRVIHILVQTGSDIHTGTDRSDIHTGRGRVTPILVQTGAIPILRVIPILAQTG